MMKKTKIILAITLILLSCLSLFSCDFKYSKFHILITGDVENEITFTTHKPSEMVKVDGKKTLILKDILKKALPYDGQSEILISGADGTACITSYASSDILYLTPSKNGWYIISTDHPPVSKIKNITSITFIDKTFNKQNGSIFNKDGNIKADGTETDFILSRGNIALMHYKIDPTKQTVGENYCYKAQKTDVKLFLYHLIPPHYEVKELTIFQRNGEIFKQKNSTIEILYIKNQINLLADLNTYTDVVGISLDIDHTVTDLYNDMKTSLDNNKNVLVIEVDGLCFDQYTKWKSELTSFSNPIVMQSVYQSISNVSLAAMLTGVSPKENGILGRGDRILKVRTIFDYAIANEKSIEYIEGNTNLLNTEVPALLSLDDDNVFQNTSMVLNTKNLIFTHFHSLDDKNHAHGKFSTESKSQLLIIDNYINSLLMGHVGDVFIISDHGSHYTTEDGEAKGNHGSASYEDMIIPYFRYIA